MTEILSLGTVDVVTEVHAATLWQDSVRGARPRLPFRPHHHGLAFSEVHRLRTSRQFCSVVPVEVLRESERHRSVLGRP